MACAALIVAGTMASCTPDMDGWGADSAYDRLFSSTSLSVEPGDSWAEVTYATVNGAQQYQIQVMKCTNPETEVFNDSVADDAEGLISYTSTQTPDTIRGLLGETSYKLRIRSVAEGKKTSKWSYYASSTGKSYFTTDKEQIFNDVATSDRGETTIRLTWPAGATVDKIVCTQGETEAEYTLTEEEIAAGEKTFTDLTPATSYTFAIYSGTSKRGDVTVSTQAQAPDGDYKVYLTESETVIDNNYLNAIAEEAAADGKTNYAVTVVIPEGQTVSLVATSETGEDASVKIPDGMSLTVFGVGGTGVVKMPKALNIAGKHNTIKFQQLTLQGESDGSFINQSAEANVENIVIEDCTFKDFTKYVIRVQGSSALSATINKIQFKNTIVQNCGGSGNYGIVHADVAKGMGAVKNVEFDGCTFNNVNCGNTGIIVSKNNDMESISIQNCTFYNITTRYFCDGSKNAALTGGMNIKNCIMGKSSGDNDKMSGRWKSISMTSSDVFVLNDWAQQKLATDDKIARAIDLSSSDVFEDPANGDFTIKASDLKGYGDPRWNK